VPVETGPRAERRDDGDALECGVERNDGERTQRWSAETAGYRVSTRKIIVIASADR